MPIRHLTHLQVIRVDEETGEPIRNAKGFCIRCNPGETGLLIGRIDARNALTTYNGYADRGASEKKLLHNVFRKGDVFFNSGDMLVGDLLNYYYFKDRTGDTFRWRGENVSTQEVEGIITSVIGLQDCVVYGVEVSTLGRHLFPQGNNFLSLFYRYPMLKARPAWRPSRIQIVK